MSGEATSVSEAADHAAQAVVEAAEIASENKSAVIDEVLASAAEQVAAAEAIATDLARSALETELGRQIADTNRRVDEWLNGAARDLQSRLTTLEETVTRLTELSASAGALALATATQSIPEPSPAPIAEAITEVVDPAQTAPAESTPAAPERKRRKSFL